MATGKVKFFNYKKGWGFIVPDGGGNDLFVHISETRKEDNLDEKDVVEFEPGEGRKGPEAKNVRLIRKAGV